jgi:copper chaperone CopZ
VQIDLHPGAISTAAVSADRDIPLADLSEAVAEAGYTVVGDHA